MKSQAYKPILFNAEMVRAILDGRKTQTRRLKKPQPTSMLTLMPYRKWGSTSQMHVWTPPACAGDVLWVRETWAPFCINKNTCRNALLSHDCYCYKAGPDVCVDEYGCNWRPSIHMPKEAARIFLRVTDVRVERIHKSFFRYGNIVRNISAEGIDIGDQCRECIETYGNPCCIDGESECGVLDDIRDDFARLWDSTIKKDDRPRYGWEANPWVWVIEFERIKKPEGWPYAQP